MDGYLLRSFVPSLMHMHAAITTSLQIEVFLNPLASILTTSPEPCALRALVSWLDMRSAVLFWETPKLCQSIPRSLAPPSVYVRSTWARGAGCSCFSKITSLFASSTSFQTCNTFYIKNGFRAREPACFLDTFPKCWEGFQGLGVFPFILKGLTRTQIINDFVEFRSF